MNVSSSSGQLRTGDYVRNVYVSWLGDELLDLRSGSSELSHPKPDGTRRGARLDDFPRLNTSGRKM